MRVLAVDDRPVGGLLIEAERPDPIPAEGEVLIAVEAAGVNRADTSQRKGGYGPPPGAPDWPGLECAGVVVAIGPGENRWSVGDRVAALVAGGAYAELVAIDQSQAIAVPAEWSMVQAAALLEAAATAWSNLFDAGRLLPGETVLLHGGSSGVGSMALQLAKLRGARTITTVGSESKAEFCSKLGADDVVRYRTQDVTERVRELTDGRGVDVILDIVGGQTVADNIDRLALDGRLVVIGVQGGDEATFDLRQLLMKRAVITGSMLRRRTLAQKAALLRSIAQEIVPEINAGRISVPIDSVFPFSEAMEAHQRMEASAHCGKIVLVP